MLPKPMFDLEIDSECSASLLSHSTMFMYMSVICFETAMLEDILVHDVYCGVFI